MHFSTITAAALTAVASVSAASLGQRTAAAGAVFAMTNTAQNEIIAFDRESNGKLTETGKYSTKGAGIGVDFDTQGGLMLSPDHKFLYAANPASDEITVFEVSGSKLKLIQTVYGGDQPLSITMNKDGLVYVLDGSVAGNGVTGFKVQKDGTLKPIPNSFRALSSPIAVPGVVQFSPDGKFIVVTHKVGSNLDVFKVGDDCLLSEPITIASSGPRPFAATFGTDGTLFVIESGLPSIGNAAVSSYSLDATSGALSAITKSEKNQQTDGCWIMLTPDQRYAYTANFVSGTIASFNVAANGTVSLINGEAGTPGINSNPTDLAMSGDGKYIYDLLRGTGGVNGWAIQDDGSLADLGTFGVGGGLPVNNGASGLAAY